MDGQTPNTRLVPETKSGKCAIGRQLLTGIVIWQTERDAMRVRPAWPSERRGEAVTASRHTFDAKAEGSPTRREMPHPRGGT
jgi:hypothetical protein